MKSACAISRLGLRFTACLCLTLWLAGCATQRVDWAVRVNHYTYEQAVLDMGPPDKQAKLIDGTVVADWLVNRGYTYASGAPGPYGPFYAGYLSTYTAPSQFLRRPSAPTASSPPGRSSIDDHEHTRDAAC